MWPRVGALERALDLLFEVVSRGRFRDSPRGYPSAKDAWEEAIRAVFASGMNTRVAFEGEMGMNCDQLTRAWNIAPVERTPIGPSGAQHWEQNVPFGA